MSTVTEYTPLSGRLSYSIASDDCGSQTHCPVSDAMPVPMPVATRLSVTRALADGAAR